MVINQFNIKEKLIELSKKNLFIFLASNFLSYKYLISSGEHYKILNFLTKKKIRIIDVGGSYGESIKTFIKINKKIKIISFEPKKKSFLKLKKNFANNKNITIYNFGIGTKKNNTVLKKKGGGGEYIAGKIFTPNIYGFNLNSWSSMKKSNLVYNLKKHCENFFDKIEITEEKIKIKYLDDFYFFNPNIIKIDIEGNELDALNSASKILLYLKPLIIFELQKKNNSLEKFLLQKGYYFYIIKKNKLFKIKKLKSLNYKKTFNIISINKQNQILNEKQIYLK